VLLKRKAEKELNKLPGLFKDRIVKALFQLQQDPFLGKSLLGKLHGFYSLRVWPYRIIYTIYKRDLVVFVVAIAHRQNAYK
jgi:addiction module RelE/StbE family toxin